MQSEYTPNGVQRFWQKIDKSSGPNACWPWMGGRSNTGYGEITLDGKAYSTHRLAWQLDFGEIPTGMVVCHKCDNPSCCNPSHLFLGTTLDNIRDRNRKGRQAKGTKHGGRKLTDSQVLEIRERYATGRESQYDLAKAFGVHQSLVSLLVNRKWRP